MQSLKTWPCVILAAILWFTVAQAAPATAPEPQRNFASAEEAVSALVAALRDDKEADLRAILGPEGDRVIDSGDRYADRELHQRFVALYDEKHTIDQTSPGRAEVDVGPNDWPMPIPLVESNGRWSFDTKAGAQTVIDRRIGRNELSAIRTLLAASMRNATTSIVPGRQTAPASMRRASSVHPGNMTGFTGRWPRARPKARSAR